MTSRFEGRWAATRAAALRTEPLVLALIGLVVAAAGAVALPEFWSKVWTQALTVAIVMIGVSSRDAGGRLVERGVDWPKFVFFLVVYTLLMTFVSSWARS